MFERERKRVTRWDVRWNICVGQSIVFVRMVIVLCILVYIYIGKQVKRGDRRRWTVVAAAAEGCGGGSSIVLMYVYLK